MGPLWAWNMALIDSATMPSETNTVPRYLACRPATVQTKGHLPLGIYTIQTGLQTRFLVVLRIQLCIGQGRLDSITKG